MFCSFAKSNRNEDAFSVSSHPDRLDQLIPFGGRESGTDASPIFNPPVDYNFRRGPNNTHGERRQEPVHSAHHYTWWAGHT